MVIHQTMRKTRPSKQCEFWICLDSASIGQGGPGDSGALGVGGPGGPGGLGGPGGRVVRWSGGQASQGGQPG